MIAKDSGVEKTRVQQQLPHDKQEPPPPPARP